MLACARKVRRLVTGYAHSDLLAPTVGSKRELVGWVWYPTTSNLQHEVRKLEYMPPLWRAALKEKSGILISDWLTRDLSRVRTNLTTGDLPPAPARFPVILMRPGLASITLSYSALAQDLASNGYVVVGFDAPYRSFVTVFPDGRVFERTTDNDADRNPGILEKLVAAWTDDARFVVDQLDQLNRSDSESRLAGRMDLHRLGMFGHSLGGATAAEFCQAVSRCSAGIDIDGRLMATVVQEGWKA